LNGKLIVNMSCMTFTLENQRCHFSFPTNTRSLHLGAACAQSIFRGRRRPMGGQ
jgi:hypothetical protein